MGRGHMGQPGSWSAPWKESTQAIHSPTPYIQPYTPQHPLSLSPCSSSAPQHCHLPWSTSNLPLKMDSQTHGLWRSARPPPDPLD